MTEMNDTPVDSAHRTPMTIDTLRVAASAQGLICLDSQWLGKLAQYHFACQQGHRFTRKVRSLLNGTAACTACKDQHRFERLQQWAIQKGGRCLETVYLGRAKHRFVCAKGHEWQTSAHSIINLHSWCPACRDEARRNQLTLADGLERIQQTALANGGQCLSTSYLGTRSKYLFQCGKGHQWQTQAAKLFNGNWCPTCARLAHGAKKRLKDGLLQLQNAAQQRGGKLLSDAYTLSHALYRFRCVQGHEWECTAAQILRGSWCAKCLHASLSIGIERMKKVAKERGGECLSDTYANNRTKLLWECWLNHQWQASPAVIQQGNWCPTCSILRRCTNPKSKAALKYLAPKKIIDQ